MSFCTSSLHILSVLSHHKVYPDNEELIKRDIFPLNFRRDLSNRIHEVANVNETVSTYTSRRNSSNSAISHANSEPFEIAPHHVK